MSQPIPDLTDHALLRAYPGAEVVFDRAFVALPGGRRGTPSDLSHAMDRAGPGGTGWPVILFATGSRSFETPALLADWMRAAGLKAALVAPCTHLVPGRPRYHSPADAAVYAQVHALRRAELDYVAARLAGHGAFDLTRVIVAGVSEGAVAAASWAPDCRFPRLLMSWSIEETYFARDVALPRDPSTPILNLMGWQDGYFGARDSLSAAEQVLGHGASRLAGYPQSRVILYPSAGHRLFDHPQTRDDVVAFLAQQLRALLSGAEAPSQLPQFQNGE